MHNVEFRSNYCLLFFNEIDFENVVKRSILYPQRINQLENNHSTNYVYLSEKNQSFVPFNISSVNNSPVMDEFKTSIPK